jgi:hypothetical protein
MSNGKNQGFTRALGKFLIVAFSSFNAFCSALSRSVDPHTIDANSDLFTRRSKSPSFAAGEITLKVIGQIERNMTDGSICIRPVVAKEVTMTLGIRFPPQVDEFSQKN